MLVGLVALVSDQPKRSEPLADALRGIAECVMVAGDVQWAQFSAVSAVVTDLDLTRAAAIRCLISLRLQPWPKTPPLLCVSHRLSNKALRQAQALGASACLPFYAEPHVVVTALLNLLNPGQGNLNASVRQCAARAGAALDKAFLAAGRSSRVDLEAVDACVDPLLSALQEGGLARWLNAIQAHNNVPYQHSLVVAGLAAQFSAQIGFPEVQRRRLVRAALVHDIGKAQIPRALLQKRDPLEPDEAVLMRTHVVRGYEILRGSRGAEPAMLDAVRHHHELLDGSGYPDGLQGEAISDVVRFLTISDIYAVLTARHSYKPARTPDEAIAVLEGMSGKVEPGFVQAFGKAVARAA